MVYGTFGSVANSAGRSDKVITWIKKRQALFHGRHFEDGIILLCVRWYLRYSLSYRDLGKIIAERGLSVDHVTIWRWVQRFSPVLNQRVGRELRRPNRSWRVDETYVASPVNGRICTGLWIPLATRSILCCRRSETSRQPSYSCVWRYREAAESGRGL
jgi:hypothetical protein